MPFENILTLDGILQIVASLTGVTIAISIPILIEKNKKSRKSIRLYKLLKKLIIECNSFEDWKIKKTIDILLKEEDLLFFFNIFRLSYDELKEMDWYKVTHFEHKKKEQDEWPRLLIDCGDFHRYVICYSWDSKHNASLIAIPPIKRLDWNSETSGEIRDTMFVFDPDKKYIIDKIRLNAISNNTKVVRGTKFTRWILNHVEHLTNRKLAKKVIIETKKILQRILKGQDVGIIVSSVFRDEMIYGLYHAKSELRPLGRDRYGDWPGIIQIGERYQIAGTDIITIISDDDDDEDVIGGSDIYADAEKTPETIKEILQYWKEILKDKYRYSRKIWEFTHQLDYIDSIE